MGSKALTLAGGGCCWLRGALLAHAWYKKKKIYIFNWKFHRKDRFDRKKYSFLHSINIRMEKIFSTKRFSEMFLHTSLSISTHEGQKRLLNTAGELPSWASAREVSAVGRRQCQLCTPIDVAVPPDCRGDDAPLHTRVNWAVCHVIKTSFSCHTSCWLLTPGLLWGRWTEETVDLIGWAVRRKVLPAPLRSTLRE